MGKRSVGKLNPLDSGGRGAEITKYQLGEDAWGQAGRTCSRTIGERTLVSATKQQLPRAQQYEFNDDVSMNLIRPSQEGEMPLRQLVVYLVAGPLVEVHAVTSSLLVLDHLEIICRQTKRLQNTIAELLRVSLRAFTPILQLLTSFNLPIISPISFSWAAFVLGGSCFNCSWTTFLSPGGRLGIWERVL